MNQKSPIVMFTLALLVLGDLWGQTAGLSNAQGVGFSNTPPLVSGEFSNRGPMAEPEDNPMRRETPRSSQGAEDSLSRRVRDEVGLERVFQTKENRSHGDSGPGRRVAWSNLLPMARGDEWSKRPDEAAESRRRVERVARQEKERGLRLSLGTGEAVDAQVNLSRVDGALSSEIRMVLENRETLLSRDIRLTNADLTRFDLESDLTFMPGSVEWGFLTAYGVRREGLLGLLGGAPAKGRSRDLRLAPRMHWRSGPSSFSLRNDTEIGDGNAAETFMSTTWIRSALRAEYRHHFSEVHYSGGEIRYEYLNLPNTTRHRVYGLFDYNLELAKIWFVEAAVGAGLRFEGTAAVEGAPIGHFNLKVRGKASFAGELGVEAYERAPRDGQSLLDGSWLEPSYPMALERGWRFHLGSSFRHLDIVRLGAEIYIDRPNAQAWLQEGSSGLASWQAGSEALYSGVSGSVDIKFGEVFKARWQGGGRWDGTVAPQRPLFESDLSLRLMIPDTGTGFVVGAKSTTGEGWKDKNGLTSTLDPRHDLSLRFEQDIGKTLQLSAGVRNLLDSDLRPFPGAASGGRTFFVALKWVY